MCGIVGFAGHDLPPAIARRTLQAMADLILHRGPDGAGYFLRDGIALGHRRLSIIDPDGGAQPMQTADGHLTVTYNGEIYNYKELTAALTAAGHTFATASDTEVLLHGYEEWGRDLPNRLRGMFAFVIWDQQTRTLFGARDIFGIKPLYYYRRGGQLLFASEIKAFLPHPAFRKKLNAERLGDYLSMEYLPDDETLFRGVYKLPGAHRFFWRDGQLEIERYYDLSFRPAPHRSLRGWEDAIAAAFSRSVAAHEIADVEVGCFLSGGVDSGYVVQQVAQRTPHVRSFSVGYAEEKYSELPEARRLSRELGVQNLENIVTAEDFFSATRTIQWYMDEPLPNPAAVPLYFLAKNARRYVKVVLSGEGADELFGGYPLYAQGVHQGRYARLPRSLRRFAAAVARRLPENCKGRRFLLRGAVEPWQRYLRADYVFESAAERDRYLLHPGPAPDPDRFRRYFEGVDEVTGLQLADLHLWMPYDILLKADRMSMANSLELRVPFLDREMLEVALALPRRWRCTGRRAKITLRGAALRSLPASVAQRKKRGFPVPLHDWLKQDRYYTLVREAFTGPVARQFFDTDALCRLLDDHRAGRAANMTKIWSFYCFIQWYEVYFVAGGPPGGSGCAG